MRRLVLVLLAATAVPASAQTERFEVASVRRGGTPEALPLISVEPGGHVYAPNSPRGS